MNLSESISQDVLPKQDILKDEQKSFLDTKLGQVINSGIDIGLRYILPDLIEEQVIDIKNTLINNGLKEGIQKAINETIEFGKSTLGIFTGNFESISQAQSAIKNGGIIDTISNTLDFIVDKTSRSGFIPKSVASVIKKGKNVVLNQVSKNIENEFSKQINSIEKLETYERNWENFYKNKDFEGMEKEYKKINEKLKEVLPLENIITKGKQIENIHKLIKKQGGNFSLTEEQIRLANKLV